MTILRLVLFILVLAMLATGQQNSSQEKHSIPPSCPVTTPPAIPFTPPDPYYKSDNGKSFVVGTEKLWTSIATSGVWGWGPHSPGQEKRVEPLTTKTFWASADYDYHKEEYPELKVTGRRLDGNAPPLVTSDATNAFPGPAPGMLVGVYVPTPGCWEITGEYKDQKVSFVVWVTPLNLKSDR